MKYYLIVGALALACLLSGCSVGNGALEFSVSIETPRMQGHKDAGVHVSNNETSYERALARHKQITQKMYADSRR